MYRHPTQFDLIQSPLEDSMQTSQFRSTATEFNLPLLAALCLSSGLSVLFWLFRAYYSHSLLFIFLNWNLVLAWIPLLCAVGAWRLAPRRSSMAPAILLLLGLWLLFLPNSPYILTDLLHLAQRQNVPLWYDLLLILSFGWNGLILGFTSLWIVQGLVQEWAGRVAGWSVALFSLSLSAFGVYLGRFLRWNSWDVLTEPGALARDILARILNPLEHRQTLAVTLLLGAFLTVAYLTVVLLGRANWKFNRGQLRR